MGRRIVRIAPSFIQELITQGHTIGDGYITRVAEGVPENAKLVRCWMDYNAYPDGFFTLLFDHPDWSETTEYEVFTPRMQVEYIQDTEPSVVAGGRVWVDGR